MVAHARLPVLSESTSTKLELQPRHDIENGQQDCSTCRNALNCWTPKAGRITENDIVANLLVCRLLRGIKRDASTRTLLQVLRPQIRKIALWTRKRVKVDLDEIIADLESAAIEALLTSYVMGEQAPPGVWLFNRRFGAVRHRAFKIILHARKDRARFVSYSQLDDDFDDAIDMLNQRVTTGQIQSAPALLPQASHGHEVALPDFAVLEHALEVLNDGVTLSTLEYRILRFCVMNAGDAQGPGITSLTGRLHSYLSRMLGLPRANISRIYGIAYRKLIDATGFRDHYLAARGLVVPRDRTPRPRERSASLSADDVVLALELLQSRGRATVLDVAWALGVTDITLHKLQRQYAGMPQEEIRAALAK